MLILPKRLCMPWIMSEVINISAEAPSYSRLLDDAVQYAHTRGVTVVAAAEMMAPTLPYPFAALSNVVAVAATDNADQIWLQSNFGSFIDLCPGS